MALILAAACSDPPDPAPARPTSESTARWVEWRSPSDPVAGPVIIVVDAPGGPMDHLVADLDVTTFLNDRFHPLFRTSSEEQSVGTVRFFDGCGCPLGPALSPASPAELIAAANALIVRPEAHRCEGARFVPRCTGGVIRPAD